MSSSDIRPRVRVPRSASVNEVVLLRTLITHPMETGNRVDPDGTVVPRHIINRFTCRFNGEMVLDMEIEPSLSANPFIEFEASVPESGEFAFTWIDDDGSVYEESASISVS
ncbi:thiosulfate oxidation carrier complex protein SoxZ [Roseinatronobacter alkalisoli]|uniref:Thiosulfate oxidation carrier complex protein SoxZ n=1 Tax=Roseinatronobacter alkalisoli TaxID=3028235 RepID=A0ABT5T6K2_9RHOB|nr:thiosulfate oxidation carrier complex protein SoxZ [Roseinatronobacter sp. HJB301]MDD7970748.1 thiosulfate oxidation carrier complex protein SoxZ [Roseinatronobacter sp. HJB301]